MKDKIYKTQIMSSNIWTAETQLNNTPMSVSLAIISMA
jgi:hypothetical protein